MKRELITAEFNASGQLVMECPVGKAVRLLAINAEIAGAAGDQFYVTYSRSTAQYLLQVATNAIGIDVQRIHASIGMSHTTLTAASQNLVTGDFVVSGEQLMTMPLPDVLWPFRVILQIATFQSQTIGLTAAVYEVVDA